MKVEVYKLPKRLTIRRYVDLPRLFELLTLGRLYLPTLGTLAIGDPFECGIRAKRKRTKATRSELESRATELALFLPEEMRGPDRHEHIGSYLNWMERCSDDQLAATVLDMESREARERIVCSCWHSGDVESDAMWKIYGNRFGIALVSTVGRLARSIKGSYSLIICAPNPQEYTIAPVRYASSAKPDRLDRFYVENWWMLKRTAFAHEQEVRLFHRLAHAVNAQDGGMLIEANAQVLVKEIVLSPFDPPWVTGALWSTIRLLLDARRLKIPVRKSTHAKPPASANPILSMMELDRLRASLGVRRRRSVDT